jgi:pimeloyl-ACP methyl ester carboxylesterase
MASDLMAGEVRVEGRRVAYRANGDPAGRRGQRVLYVHGTGCSGVVWDGHLAAIADAHTAVAIDLPAHGRSEGPSFRGAADHAHVVAELASALGWERFVVAGHSMGGAVALSCALYHAERLAGLVLVDTGARLRVHPDILRGARAAAAAGRRPVTPREWAFARATPQALVDAVAAMTADIDPRVTYADWICDDSFDCLSRVGDIQLPTLAVCGQEDRLTPPAYHRFFASRIPRCELAVVRGAGHWVFQEQPEVFTRVVRDFLARLPAA